MAEALYKRARKLRRAVDAVQPLLEAAQQETSYLEEVESSLSTLARYSEPEDYRALQEVQVCVGGLLCDIGVSGLQRAFTSHLQGLEWNPVQLGAFFVMCSPLLFSTPTRLHCHLIYLVPPCRVGWFRHFKCDFTDLIHAPRFFLHAGGAGAAGLPQARPRDPQPQGGSKGEEGGEEGIQAGGCRGRRRVGGDRLPLLHLTSGASGM